MRACVALAIAAVVAMPSTTSAQTIEVCEAAWLDAEHVRAILQVELSERWDPAFDATVVRVDACETEQPRVSLIVPGREPTTLTLRLSAIAPRARTRFVALIVAELLRARAMPAAPSPGPDGPAVAEPGLPPSELAPSELAAAPPRSSELATSPPPSRVLPGSELAAPVLATPELTSPPIVAGAEALDAPAASPVAAVVPAAPGALASDELPDPVAAHRTAPPTDIALDAPDASPSGSPWRLAMSASVRVFAPPVVPAALVDVSLRYDRLLVSIAGGGTELGSPAGTVRMAQLTLGVGVRLVEHRGRIRVGWDVRGDAGAAMSAGDRASLAIDGHMTFTYVLAASTQLEVVWPVGPIELGFTTDLGYQRGIVELGPFAQGGLGGVFASLGGTVAWSL